MLYIISNNPFICKNIRSSNNIVFIFCVIDTLKKAARISAGDPQN